MRVSKETRLRLWGLAFAVAVAALAWAAVLR